MYSFDSRVRYSESDENGRLSLFSMINYLQDCSIFQSEDLGVGNSYLTGKKRAWFLAAWDIVIDDLPCCYDRINVSTWAYGFRGIYGYRNFRICDPEGRSLVRADSLWFMMDTEAGRPVRPAEEDIAPYLKAEFTAPRIDMPPLERKLVLPERGFVSTAPVTVGKHHLDTNHHVNNARYVEMAREALAEVQAGDGRFGQQASDLKILRLEVQYKKAAVLGDTICPQAVFELPGTGSSSLRGYVDLADPAGETFAAARVTFL